MKKYLKTKKYKYSCGPNDVQTSCTDCNDGQLWIIGEGITSYDLRRNNYSFKVVECDHCKKLFYPMTGLR